MDRLLREALGIMLFAGLLVPFAALSLAIAELRMVSFVERLLHDISILSERARVHLTNISLTLPGGDHALSLDQSGQAIEFVPDWLDFLDQPGNPKGFLSRSPEIQITLTSDGRVIAGG